MIVIVLRIGNAACIAYSHCASLIYHMRCMAIDHRLQAHFSNWRIAAFTIRSKPRLYRIFTVFFL